MAGLTLGPGPLTPGLAFCIMLNKHGDHVVTIVEQCNTVVMLTTPRRFPRLRAEFLTRLPSLQMSAADLGVPRALALFTIWLQIQSIFQLPQV